MSEETYPGADLGLYYIADDMGPMPEGFAFATVASAVEAIRSLQDLGGEWATAYDVREDSHGHIVATVPREGLGGLDAIRWALAHELDGCWTYADPTSDGGWVTIDHALQIASEDPSLVYI